MQRDTVRVEHVVWVKIVIHDTEVKMPLFTSVFFLNDLVSFIDYEFYGIIFCGGQDI